MPLSFILAPLIFFSDIQETHLYVEYISISCGYMLASTIDGVYIHILWLYISQNQKTTHI